MSITIDALTRYPVKGLSGEQLKRVVLEAGQGFPFDRQYGFARPNSGFDPSNPKPLPKTKFYMLARDASLVLIESSFNEETGELSLVSPQTSGTFDISSEQGRADASTFVKAYLNLPDNEAPMLYSAQPHRFTDVSVVSSEMMNAVSIINKNSVTAFSQAIGVDVDPGRFRGNLLVSGLPAFAELNMLEQEIAIGTVRLKLVKRTKRCPATEVDLRTGERDIKTPKRLLEQYGHMDMGVYAEVVGGGTIAIGDSVEII